MIIRDIQLFILIYFEISIFILINVRMNIREYFRYLKWCSILERKKQRFCSLRMVKMFDVNMMNGFFVIVKMVGMELIVNSIFVNLIIIRQVSRIVVICFLFLWIMYFSFLWFYLMGKIFFRSFILKLLWKLFFLLDFYYIFQVEYRRMILKI